MSNSEQQRILEQRRAFLADIGLGGAALGMFGAAFALWPREVAAQPSVACAPPGNPGTPVAWRADCRPIQFRRPASTLSPGEIQKLRDAYKEMRALQTADPNDPRGFLRQANVHCWNCSVPANQQHFSWRFFTWHRAMLYFHERILGKLVGDGNLRLPYWDWELPSHRTMPSAYAEGDATNPLFNATRTLSPTGTLDEASVGEDVMEGALTLATFAEFGGTASSSGSPEFTPHGHPHIRVGGDMRTFETAARDPIFFVHHANLDKLWSDWNRAAATHTNPTDSAYLNLTFTFYDEEKRWTSIRASQLLDHESHLRYRYGPSLFLERLPCILHWIVVRTTWRTDRKIRFDARVAQPFARMDKQSRVRLHIQALQLPLDRSTEYRLYASEAEARADQGPGAEGFLGTVPVVLNSEHQRHAAPEKRAANLIFNITRQLPKLLQRQRDLELFLVDPESKAPQKLLIPVRATDVFFSRGDAK